MFLGNKHKYSLLRAYALLRAFFYSLLSIFMKKNDNIIITSALNKFYSDNSSALFEILMREDAYKDRTFFVINDEIRRDELNQLFPGKFISNSSFDNVLFILRAKHWFCSSLELPLPVYFQRGLHQIGHLGHGMLYKKVGLIEANVNWYKRLYYWLVCSNFSYTIASSEFCGKYIARAFGLEMDRVLITPQPKTVKVKNPSRVDDPLLLNDDLVHVLYAPTWRPYGNVWIFPFADFCLETLSGFLAEHNIHIWLRVHPLHDQDVPEEILLIENVHLFSDAEYVEINGFLNYFDALISDYSSIYYDFLTLRRPVLFFDYDLDEFATRVGLIDEYESVKCSETVKTFEKFLSDLLLVKNGTFDLTEVGRIDRMVNYDVTRKDAAQVLLGKFFESTR